MQIMVVGQVKARAYLDQSGQPQSSLELTADNMQFLGSRDGGGMDVGSEDYGAAENMSDIPF
jgi:single-stranded DNA-binding protein